MAGRIFHFVKKGLLEILLPDFDTYVRSFDIEGEVHYSGIINGQDDPILSR